MPGEGTPTGPCIPGGTATGPGPGGGGNAPTGRVEDRWFAGLSGAWLVPRQPVCGGAVAEVSPGWFERRHVRLGGIEQRRLARYGLLCSCGDLAWGDRQGLRRGVGIRGAQLEVDRQRCVDRQRGIEGHGIFLGRLFG